MRNKRITMKKYNIITVLILIYSLFLVGCNVASNTDIEYYKNENENLKLENAELNEIINNYKNNENIQQEDSIEKSNTGVLDILHVKDISGTYYIVLTVKSDENHSVTQLWKYAENSVSTLLAEGIDINIEIRNEFLYCTVLKNEENDEYVEEVLKFDNENNVSLIYKGKNVEISASADGEYFVIIENPPESYTEIKNIDLQNVRKLKILDRNDKIVYEENIPSKMYTDLEPIGWNNSMFWANFNYAGGHPELFIFDTETLNYEIIENKADYFESELNIKTGWICYSNYPPLRDVDTYNEFKQSNQEINLYLWNLFTDKKIEIETSIAKAFSPKWIDDYTLEYNHPIIDQKKFYKLNSNN